MAGRNLKSAHIVEMPDRQKRPDSRRPCLSASVDSLSADPRQTVATNLGSLLIATGLTLPPNTKC